jgi:hypothetical protein
MAEDALRAAIDEDHPSILRGAFRTPTLRRAVLAACIHEMLVD